MDRQRGEGVVAPQPSRALLDEVSQVRLASGAARLAARRCITASSAAASRYNRTLLRCSEAASTTAGLCQDAIQVRGAQPAAGSLEWSVLRPFAQRLGWPFDGLPPPSVGDAATARSLVRIHEGLIELARTSEVRNRGDAEARALRVTLLEARAAHWRSEVHRLTGVHLRWPDADLDPWFRRHPVDTSRDAVVGGFDRRHRPMVHRRRADLARVGE